MVQARVDGMSSGAFGVRGRGLCTSKYSMTWSLRMTSRSSVAGVYHGGACMNGTLRLADGRVNAVNPGTNLLSRDLTAVAR